MRNANDNISCELDESVPHVFVDDRAIGVSDAIEAEIEQRLSKHTHFLGKHVVAVESYGGEIPNFVEFEDDPDRRLVGCFVFPANPFVTFFSVLIRIETEVAVSLRSVRQLTQTSSEICITDCAVISEVIKVHFCTPSLTLWHAIRQNTV